MSLMKMIEKKIKETKKKIASEMEDLLFRDLLFRFVNDNEALYV